MGNSEIYRELVRVAQQADNALRLAIVAYSQGDMTAEDVADFRQDAAEAWRAAKDAL